jgi:hypothetical protein
MLRLAIALRMATKSMATFPQARHCTACSLEWLILRDLLHAAVLIANRKMLERIYLLSNI